MVPGNNNFIQVLWIIGASHTHPHAEVKTVINICVVLTIIVQSQS